MSRTRIAVVGAGWRAEFFIRIASQLGDDFELVGIAARRHEAAEHLRRQWRVPVYATAGELARQAAADVVVVSVPPAVNASVVEELVGVGARVLAETPPATSLADMRSMWRRCGGGRRLVQVAEQYLLMPGHAARLEVIRRGIIGRPTSVHVSSTHTYHAVSLMRGMLGERFGPATVRAFQHTAPLIDPIDRAGWTDDQEPKVARNIIATVDFGDTLGVYDFTDNQWHNRLRRRRILVRGTTGEIADDYVVHMSAPRTIVTSHLSRSQLGYDLNLDGYDTEHILFEGDVVFHNPFIGHRLMDEEIAMASMMARAGRWARDEGAPPYPLDEAMQDQLIGLAIDAAVERSEPVTTSVEEWAVAASAN